MVDLPSSADDDAVPCEGAGLAGLLGILMAGSPSVRPCQGLASWRSIAMASLASSRSRTLYLPGRAPQSSRRRGEPVSAVFAESGDRRANTFEAGRGRIATETLAAAGSLCSGRQVARLEAPARADLCLGASRPPSIYTTLPFWPDEATGQRDFSWNFTCHH